LRTHGQKSEYFDHQKKLEMTPSLSECPNCGAKIKESSMFGNYLLFDEKTKIINLYNDKQSPAYCSKCGNEL